MTAAAPRRFAAVRATLLAAPMLGVALGITWAAAQVAPHGLPWARAIASLGFLLLAGNLCAELIEPLGVPHLTGYLAAGLLAGPEVLGLVDAGSVAALQKVNGLALALIAFAAGAELSVDVLRGAAGRLAVAASAQVVVLPIVLGAVFFLASPWMPFLVGKPALAVAGLALMWGVVGAVKSPAAILGVLAETPAAGPLTQYAVAMVVLLDVAVLILFQLASLVARTLIVPGSPVSVGALAGVGHELLSSVAVGTTLGLLTGMYLAWVERGVILLLVALAFFTAQLDAYFGYDVMLVFAAAGFVVRNLTEQGHKLLAAIRRSGSTVFVVFFAVAGSHLDLATLRQLWPLALLFAGARGVATFGAAAAANALSKESPAVRRWGWAPLISQAGVALGIALAVERAFPSVGDGFRSLAVAVVGLNEAVGPVLFKLSLARAGEIRASG